MSVKRQEWQSYVTRSSPYTSDSELDALVRAGLGNVEQRTITPEQRAAALRGERVKLTARQKQQARDPRGVA